MTLSFQMVSFRYPYIHISLILGGFSYCIRCIFKKERRKKEKKKERKKKEEEKKKKEIQKKKIRREYNIEY